jgi:hypothetical protein
MAKKRLWCKFAAMNSKYNYPQFRKLSNERSFYAIHSVDTMTEIKRTERKWAEYQMIARILPERLLIKDLLDCSHEHYEIITASDYDYFRAFCQDHLEKTDL